MALAGCANGPSPVVETATAPIGTDTAPDEAAPAENAVMEQAPADGEVAQPETVVDQADAGWSDTVQLTVRSTAYEGYTLDFSYSIPELTDGHIDRLDATALDEYDLALRVPMSFSVVNVTPGDRPLPTTFTANFLVKLEYAPGAAVCRTPREAFKPKREDLSSGGCRVSAGFVTWPHFTKSDGAQADLVPGQTYTAQVENLADASNPFFTPHVSSLSGDQVAKVTEALLDPSGLFITYVPDDGITGIGYDLETPACELNVIASRKDCGG